MKFVTHSRVSVTYSCVFVTHSYDSPFFCALSHLCSTLRMLVRVKFVTHSCVTPVEHEQNVSSRRICDSFMCVRDSFTCVSDSFIHLAFFCALSHPSITLSRSVRVEFVTLSYMLMTPSCVFVTHAYTPPFSVLFNTCRAQSHCQRATRSYVEFVTYLYVFVTHLYTPPFSVLFNTCRAQSHCQSATRSYVEFVTYLYVFVTHAYTPPSSVLSITCRAQSHCQSTTRSYMEFVTHLYVFVTRSYMSLQVTLLVRDSIPSFTCVRDSVICVYLRAQFLQLRQRDGTTQS